VRNSKERPENPIEALKDYFGEYRDDSWKEFN